MPTAPYRYLCREVLRPDDCEAKHINWNLNAAQCGALGESAGTVLPPPQLAGLRPRPVQGPTHS